MLLNVFLKDQFFLIVQKENIDVKYKIPMECIGINYRTAHCFDQENHGNSPI